MPHPRHSHDVVILGAGAAGLMCARIAGQRGKRVLLIEHGDAPGRKILISGGGRCNFTNLHTKPASFLSGNAQFATSALSRFTPQDMIDLVTAHGIAWHEKTLGQLFCDGAARQIVHMLRAECPENVSLQLGESVRDVTHRDGLFHLAFDHSRHTAPRLVIATGGPSIPKMGATGIAYELAKRFGLAVVPPRPALVPLTLGPADADFRDLSGVALPTRVTLGTARFDEASLFTHRGLSGPAILQISSYWRAGDTLLVDFLPGHDTLALLKAARRQTPHATLRTLLAGHLPSRLAAVLAARLGYDGPLANLSDQKLTDAARRVAAWPYVPTGSEGYAKAEVTAGGIDTHDLSSKTMEARHVPGLFVIGEAVDVTGWLGGYNFQWAWASGVAAGLAI